jgi:hypothetical protein
MEKRIASLTTNPHTVNLTDRPCSLFIDPKTRCILVDEGEGDGRMNGVVFSPRNRPVFTVRPASESEHQFVLDYCGVSYFVGVSTDAAGLRSWAASANAAVNQNERSAKGAVSGVNGSIDESSKDFVDAVAPGSPRC